MHIPYYQVQLTIKLHTPNQFLIANDDNSMKTPKANNILSLMIMFFIAITSLLGYKIQEPVKQ